LKEEDVEGGGQVGEEEEENEKQTQQGEIEDAEARKDGRWKG
jgi:hypothetical protein